MNTEEILYICTSCGIKENADIVIDSVWEDGVFRYIEDVFLKK